MDRKTLLQYCRYYKGGDVCPFDDERQMLWFYEQSWVTAMLNDDDMLEEYISDYVIVGLHDFSVTDDVPMSLKALLFNRYAKTAQSMVSAARPFRDFYKRFY